jgi:predicted Zn-dependent protease
MEDTSGFTALGNNKGLFGYNKSTSVDFSVTVRTADGTGSGFVQRDYNDAAKLNSRTATDIAMQKALASATAKALEPGKYTRLSSNLPRVLTSLLNMMRSFDARNAPTRAGVFWAKKEEVPGWVKSSSMNGSTFIPIPANTEIPGSPFAGDGRPQEKVVWVENGVVKNMYYSRFWAEKQGVKAIPSPSRYYFSGGSESLADLIKGTEKGILVTRLWYIRAVDPQTLLYTGLTRDGTFYIENGQIKYPVKNFRFNESPVIMLNNLEAIGKSGTCQRQPHSALKIRDFTFTSFSDAVYDAYCNHSNRFQALSIKVN